MIEFSPLKVASSPKMHRFSLSLRPLLALALLCGLLTTQDASAQVPNDRFSVQNFAPAPGPGNYLQVEGANISGHLAFGAGLTIDYAHNPFSIYSSSCSDPDNCNVGEEQTALVANLAQANLYASFMLVDRLQIGLNLPLLLASGDEFIRFNGSFNVPGGTEFAVGDPVLSLKARIFSSSGFFLGATVYGSFPVATQMADGFLGDESFRVGGHLIGQLILSGFHLSVNVGGFYRPERTFLSTRAASALVYRGAIGYQVTPLLMLFAEIDGRSGLSAELDEHALEARLAGRLQFGDFNVSLAGGAGIISGVGVPVFRVIGGFAYSPTSGDQDGDGVPDDIDGCPTEPEDLDGFDDGDGCPDPDNDMDGLEDHEDPCPDEAEDIDGFEDEDGCPDTDNDQDGVPDGFDSCPDVPEDMDGDRDDDGCPDNDTDRDGIDDVHDQCPEVSEDLDGLGDEDGCPEDDFDGDGIPDDMDQCAFDPETHNGIADEDGCPEEDTDGDGVVDELDQCPNEAETLNSQRDDDGCPDGPALVERQGVQLVPVNGVAFRRNNRPHRRSDQTLDTIANYLNAHREFTNVRVEVSGENAQLRANYLMAALVERGVEEGRLTAITGDGGDGIVRVHLSDPPAEPASANTGSEATSEPAE